MSAGPFEAAIQAVSSVLDEVAAAAEGAVGLKFAVHTLPDPTMDRTSVWIEPPTRARVSPRDLNGYDETMVALDVCVSIPYELQRDDQLAAWKLCDVLIEHFPDQMVGNDDLRGTRTRSIQPLREQWGGDQAGPVQLVVRCHIEVPVYTPVSL